MEIKAKLSKNFNKKLFGEIKRNLLFKSIVSITLISFVKALASVLDVFVKPSIPKEIERTKKDD